MIALATITTLTSGCMDADPRPGTATPSATNAALPPTQRACEIPLPQAWQQELDNSGIDIGGPTTALAVGPDGEIAVARNEYTAGDLLLIKSDKSITTIYPIAEPHRYRVGAVSMDARWIVVGVEIAPRTPPGDRYTNAPLPALSRIDVIHRPTGHVRTVVEFAVDGGPALDSFALFGDKVYWLTRNRWASDDGFLQAYELSTGAVTDVESGRMRWLHAELSGVSWAAEGHTPPIVMRPMAPLPAAIAAAPGLDEDQYTLATDGTGYAWITEANAGGTGVTSWTPDNGLQRFSISALFGPRGPMRASLYVDGPYVVVDAGLRPGDGATVLDTRSGAAASVRNRITGAGGGTIATQVRAPGSEFDAPGLAHANALPPLTC
jgi:hypothetical protein